MILTVHTKHTLLNVMVTEMDQESTPLIWWKWKPSNIRQRRSSTKSTSLTIQMRYKCDRKCSLVSINQLLKGLRVTRAGLRGGIQHQSKRLLSKHLKQATA